MRRQFKNCMAKYSQASPIPLPSLSCLCCIKISKIERFSNQFTFLRKILRGARPPAALLTSSQPAGYFRKKSSFYSGCMSELHHRRRNRQKRRQRSSLLFGGRTIHLTARMIWRKVFWRISILGGWWFGVVWTRLIIHFSEDPFCQASILLCILFFILVVNPSIHPGGVVELNEYRSPSLLSISSSTVCIIIQNIILYILLLKCLLFNMS